MYAFSVLCVHLVRIQIKSLIWRSKYSSTQTFLWVTHPMIGGIRKMPTLVPAQQCYQHTLQQLIFLNLPVLGVRRSPNRSRVPPPQMKFWTQFMRMAAAKWVELEACIKCRRLRNWLVVRCRATVVPLSWSAFWQHWSASLLELNIMASIAQHRNCKIS